MKRLIKKANIDDFDVKLRSLGFLPREGNRTNTWEFNKVQGPLTLDDFVIVTWNNSDVTVTFQDEDGYNRGHEYCGEATFVQFWDKIMKMTPQQFSKYID